MDYTDEFGKLVGIHVFEVVVLVDVSLEVIKERFSLAGNKLPVALPHTNHLCRPVAHLPIEELVLTLFPVLS